MVVSSNSTSLNSLMDDTSAEKNDSNALEARKQPIVREAAVYRCSAERFFKDIGD